MVIFLKPREGAEILAVDLRTLVRWEQDGQINRANASKFWKLLSLRLIGAISINTQLAKIFALSGLQNKMRLPWGKLAVKEVEHIIGKDQTQQ